MSDSSFSDSRQIRTYVIKCLLEIFTLIVTDINHDLDINKEIM